MNTYEALFMAKANLKPEDEKGLVTQIKETLTKNGANISNFQEWGKKRLAYRVKKQDEANYYLLNFETLPENLIKAEKTFMLNENILRFVFIRKEHREEK